MFAAESGLTAWAANASIERIVRDPMLRGALLENFVLTELAARAAWSPEPTEMLHWRDSRARREVDLVLRRRDGALLAIEVTSAATVDADDARGINTLAERSADDFAAGIVIHTGRFTTQLDERVWAVPVSSLW